MALSSRDPIMATFELRQEMKKLAQVEKEFQVRISDDFRFRFLLGGASVPGVGDDDRSHRTVGGCL